MCIHCENVPLRNFLTYMDVSACKFSHAPQSVYNLSHNFLCLAATDMFPRCVSTTRRVHARVHTLKDRCLLTFWVTKSFLCVTLNKWHHVSHQILNRQVETMYNRITSFTNPSQYAIFLHTKSCLGTVVWPTRRTAMHVHCEKSSLYKTFWLTRICSHENDLIEARVCIQLVAQFPMLCPNDMFPRSVSTKRRIHALVSACKFSHERTCLYTTCSIIAYVWARPACFPRSVSNTRHVHARVHTLKDGCLYTFWLTKSCLCVTLNISHLVCHIISYATFVLRGQSFFLDGVYILWWLCTRIYWDIWLGKTAVNVWTNVRGMGRTRVDGHETRPKPKPNVDYYLVSYLLLLFLLLLLNV